MATKQTKKPKVPARAQKLSQVVKTDNGVNTPQTTPQVTPTTPATPQANTQTLVYRTPTAGSNNDISQIFQGIKNSRGMIRRYLSGNIMPDNQGGGGSLGNFLSKYPHLSSPQAANND